MVVAEVRGIEHHPFARPQALFDAVKIFAAFGGRGYFPAADAVCFRIADPDGISIQGGLRNVDSEAGCLSGAGCGGGGSRIEEFDAAEHFRAEFFVRHPDADLCLQRVPLEVRFPGDPCHLPFEDMVRQEMRVSMIRGLLPFSGRRVGCR